MTRGRKKDMTIPPTRALVQQRDYRARKAHYISELEERCRRAEEENAQLRKDLETVRASLSVPYLFNPIATELSAELQHNLALVSNSLAKFQSFAEQHPLPAGPSRGVQLPPIQDCFRATPPLAHPPLPAPISLQTSPTHHFSPPTRMHPHSHDSGYGRVSTSPPPRSHKRPCRQDSPSSSRSHSGGAPSQSSSRFEPDRSSSPDSECCGGILDCSELICQEEEHDHSPADVRPLSPSSSYVRYVPPEERSPSGRHTFSLGYQHGNVNERVP